MKKPDVDKLTAALESAGFEIVLLKEERVYANPAHKHMITARVVLEVIPVCESQK